MSTEMDATRSAGAAASGTSTGARAAGESTPKPTAPAAAPAPATTPATAAAPATAAPPAAATPGIPAPNPGATTAAAYFAARLRFETDPSDVYAAQKRGDAFVLVDVRSDEAWAQGHVDGAIHMPYAQMPSRALVELDLTVPVVVYCWSPGCNAGHKGALALSQLGFNVREMLGGYEYWVREGQPTTSATGPLERVFDPLTMVVRTQREQDSVGVQEHIQRRA